MSAIALPPEPLARLSHRRVEVACVGLGLAAYAARVLWPDWETIPVPVAWLVLMFVCGIRVWPAGQTRLVLYTLTAAVVTAMVLDNLHVIRLWGGQLEVPPFLALIFLGTVWDARRRSEELLWAARQAEERRALLDLQEQFMNDVSHELRTPVTIAQGHLELLRRRGLADPEVTIALDELGRIRRIIERLLVLAGAEQPEFLQREAVALEPFLEDEFVRWADIAPRSWRLGPIVAARLDADPERLRTALDALVENAVKYTQEGDAIELRARADERGHVVIEVQDAGCGIAPDAVSMIFERFRRSEPESHPGVGGVGLGLAIADAIARGHGGRCTVRPVDDAAGGRGSVFGLELPAHVEAEPRRPVWLEPPALSAEV